MIGFVKDKEIDKILTLLPQNAQYYFCNAYIPRALPAENLCEIAAQYWLNGIWYHSVELAYLKALKTAKITDLVFIGGSTFVVADFLKYKLINN